ncbi:hypothetical protein ACFFRR_000347 [Megaselia abdita]
MKVTQLFLVFAFVALCVFQVSEAHFDLGNIGHDLHKDVDKVGNDVDSVGHDVSNAAHDVASSVENAGKDIDNEAHDASKAVKSTEGQKIIKTAGTVVKVAGIASDADSIIHIM